MIHKVQCHNKVIKGFKISINTSEQSHWVCVGWVGVVFSLACFWQRGVQFMEYVGCATWSTFPNVTAVTLCFCPLLPNILLSASPWAETLSSGRQISPLLRWRWTDCWLHPVEPQGIKLKMQQFSETQLLHFYGDCTSSNKGINQMLYVYNL